MQKTGQDTWAGRLWVCLWTRCPQQGLGASATTQAVAGKPLSPEAQNLRTSDAAGRASQDSVEGVGWWQGACKGAQSTDSPQWKIQQQAMGW